MTRQEYLKRKIKSLQRFYRISNKDMGTKLHVSERSFVRRMSDVSEMKVGDLLKLEDVLHTKFLDVGDGTK